MQSTRFPLFLVAGLALALGLSLSVPDAKGYPAGAAVSLGTNPVFSQGGSVERGDADSVLTAPADMDLVITDVSLGIFTNHYYCKQVLGVRLYLVDETILARYPIMIDIYRHGGIYNQTVNMQSGIRLPAGEAMLLWVESGASEGCSDARVDYTFSGYYAQP